MRLGMVMALTFALSAAQTQDEAVQKDLTQLQGTWVRISRQSGFGPWFAYGVINDGSAPGLRTGDGAFVPMQVTKWLQ